MAQFELTPYKELETADAALDYESKTLQINWKGNVDFEDYQEVLLSAVKLAEEGKLINLVLNRLNLVELNVECRVWLKNDFLKGYAKPVIPLLRKVATVEAKSTWGRFYTNAITKTVSIVYPNMSFKSFSSEDEAYDWIGSEDSAKIPEKKNPQVTDRKPIKSPAAQQKTSERKSNELLGKVLDFLFGGKKEKK